MRCFLGLHRQPLRVVGTYLGVLVMQCTRCGKHLVGGIQ